MITAEYVAIDLNQAHDKRTRPVWEVKDSVTNLTKVFTLIKGDYKNNLWVREVSPYLQSLGVTIMYQAGTHLWQSEKFSYSTDGRALKKILAKSGKVVRETLDRPAPVRTFDEAELDRERRDFQAKERVSAAERAWAAKAKVQLKDKDVRMEDGIWVVYDVISGKTLPSTQEQIITHRYQAHKSVEELEAEALKAAPTLPADEYNKSPHLTVDKVACST